MYYYSGILECYFATGEGPFPIIIVNHRHPDVWKKTYAFEKQEKPMLTIKHPQTKEIVYQGPWSYSRKKTAENNYFPTPSEIDSRIWVSWCQKQFLVEAQLSSKIEADLCSVSINYEVDVWEVGLDTKTLIAQACRIYPLLEGRKFDAVKVGFQWWSPEVIKNFSYIEKDKELYVFTDNNQYLILPKENIINADSKVRNEFHLPMGCLKDDTKLKGPK